MGTTFKRLGLSELLPRYVFAEGLYARRRVLEVGAVATTRGESARFLLTRGARTVLACDADVGAVEAANKANSAQGLRYRANVFDDLEGGSFDVVMVADLAPYVRAPELLRELTRLLSRGGVLIGGLRNPAGLALSMVMEAEEGEPPPTWGQLLDALSSHFPSVEVATQSPVLGYQLAFERGDGLQVDGSLAEATEAAYFVAIAGQEPVRAVDPTWVQLPPEPLAYTGGKLEESARRGREWQERTERMKELLERAKKDVSTKESDLKEVREQLLGAREGVARLTVQLEELGKRPRALEQQDELAGRIRRLEAELGVARERAQDAEGRVHASRAESDAQARAQKDAAVEAIAAQEIARLERSRREELVTQLEDARTRLASAYEQHGKLQDELANGRVELERTRLQADRIVETLSVRERELATAKEREVKLAEGRSEALSAVEVLEGQLEQLRARSGEALAQLERKESERLAAMRSVELETQSRMRFEQDLSRSQAELAQAQALVQQLEGERPAFDTELQEAKAGANRLARDIEVLAGSERTWRAMAQELEQRLANTQANVETLSEQLTQAEAAKEAEVARYRRLEKDLTTAVGAERSAREQAEVALAATREDVSRLSAQTRELSAQRDGLDEKVAELEGKRSSIAGQAGELEGRVKQLEAHEAELTKALGEAREAEATLRQDASEQGRQWAIERARFTGRLDEVGGALVQAQSLVSGLDLKLARLTAEAAEALQKGTEAVRALDERVETLTRELAARTADRDALAGDLIEEEARAQGLAAELAEHQSLLASAEVESNQRKAAIGQLQQKLEESERRFQSTDVELHKQISALEETGRKQTAEAAAAKASLEEMLRKGQAVLDRTRHENQEATAALVSAHEAKLAALGAEQADARRDHQQKLEALAAEQARERQAHQDQLAALSAEQQQARVGEVETLSAEHRRQLEALEARAEQERQAHRQQLAALSAEHAQAQQENQQQLDALAAAHEQARAESQQRIDRLVADLEQTRKEHQQQSGAISSELELEQQKHRQEVEAIRGELERARADHQQQSEASAGELAKVRAALEASAAELQRLSAEHQQKL
ncbi:MAG: hypothetical protein H6Q89_2385, partial [Myxococcaceae bacterium]|nr:hypothetical protein [Myxococcaceae bacterium]